MTVPTSTGTSPAVTVAHLRDLATVERESSGTRTYSSPGATAGRVRGVA